MVLADFVALPVARRAKLEEAHVVALRLYSTAAFRALNGPMRNLKMSHCRKGEDGSPLPLEPPQLAAPHPQPVTMAFIYEALKRMRAVAAATTVDPECKKMEELAVAGELSLETLRQASRQARRDEEGGDEESQQEGSGLEEGRATGVSKSSYLGSVDQSVGEGHGERTGAGRGSAPLSALQAVARAFGCERRDRGDLARGRRGPPCRDAACLSQASESSLASCRPPAYERRSAHSRHAPPRRARPEQLGRRCCGGGGWRGRRAAHR
mmetsp:Transcript_19092/g.56326  ORF Transcript_19092/g.56326 Transcript_19092/m.56326 type:complete len:267 (+) Transcript_19092:937-1737(+)